MNFLQALGLVLFWAVVIALAGSGFIAAAIFLTNLHDYALFGVTVLAMILGAAWALSGTEVK